MTTGSTVDLHYTLEGPEDAPVLVMSNSLGTTLHMWDDQAPLLGERFRLLRYDHRGHGASPVPPGPYTVDDLGWDVLALLDRLEIENFSFCGLSLGGMTGMWLASEIPERVERLVLCCTSAKLGPPENWTLRAETVREGGLKAVSDAVLEIWFTVAFRGSNHQAVEWARSMLESSPPEGYASCCEAIRDMDLTGRLGEILAPTLVIAGAEDEATPPEHAGLICDSLSDCSLEVISQAAHLANIEQPEAVTRAIIEHLVPVLKTRSSG